MAICYWWPCSAAGSGTTGDLIRKSTALSLTSRNTERMAALDEMKITVRELTAAGTPLRPGMIDTLIRGSIR